MWPPVELVPLTPDELDRRRREADQAQEARVARWLAKKRKV